MQNLESHLLGQHSDQIEIVRRKYHDLNNSIIKIEYKVGEISSNLEKISTIIEALEKQSIEREAQIRLIKASYPWAKAIALGIVGLLVWDHKQIWEIAKVWMSKW